MGKPVATVLVVHGAGMEKRGLEAIETFGSMKLGEYEEAIRGYARSGLRRDVFSFERRDGRGGQVEPDS